MPTARPRPASCWRRYSPSCCSRGSRATGCSIRSGAGCRPPTATTMAGPAGERDAARDRHVRTRSREVKNQVQLIAYVDRLGGTFAGLRDLLAGRSRGYSAACTCCRSSIRSTAPMRDSIRSITREVDARLGTWDDVARARARDVDVMADVIVNHISSRSPQFLDFAEQGARSAYAGMFLTFDGVFPNGAAERDLLAIYRPRPGLPFTPMTLGGWHAPNILDHVHARADRHRRHASARACEYLEEILRTFGANGIKMVRLDAVGYAIKKAGTSCFMMAETFEFIGAFSARATALRPRGAGRGAFVLPAADRDRAARGLGVRLRVAAARAARFLAIARHAL